jgi:hypothetical protein
MQSVDTPEVDLVRAMSFVVLSPESQPVKEMHSLEENLKTRYTLKAVSTN